MVDKRSITCKTIWRHLYIKYNILIQKARVRWNHEGDLNSKVFHNIVNGRASRKFIGAANTEKGLVDSVDGVKDAIWSFFKNKFTELGENRPSLEGISLKSLFHAEVEYLEAPFLDEEIKEDVWSCDGSKSLGPNEYNFVFIKNCWNILKEEITNFM